VSLVSEQRSGSGEAIEPVFAVVSPSGAQVLDQLRPADPLADLAGTRIAFVWDLLFDGDIVFDAMAAELAATYGSMEFIGFEEFGDIHGGEEHRVLAELPDRLRQHRVDAVVAGVGA
jgi:hypothetical protein